MGRSNDHLDEAALLDAAEDASSQESAAHLAGCEPCRAQVEELRAMMRVAEDVPVPEPSPLFWDHLSARVREAVAEDAADEHQASPAWIPRLWNWQMLVSAAAVGAVILAVTVGRRSPSETGTVELPPAAAPSTASAPAELTPLVDNDPSLSFLGDLASDLDWDDAVEAGLTGGAGAVDRIVLDMSDDERRELQRVLREAMGQPGA